LIENLYICFFLFSPKGNFSKNPNCIRKIPLNPPLQKREAVGIPELIENLPQKYLTHSNGFF
jgi:hypothetical protein